jgi:hypothetical protein
MVKNAIVTDNRSVDYGGGLDIDVSQTVLVKGGLVAGNVSDKGGGMFLQNAAGSVTGTTITGNAATNEGGGVLQFSSVNLTLATIIANSAPAAADVAT